METSYQNTTATKVCIEEKQTEFCVQEIKLSLTSVLNHNCTAKLQGLKFEDVNVAIIKKLQFATEEDGIALINEAAMIAWELGYDLLIANQSLSLFSKCSLQSSLTQTQQATITELTWEASKKIKHLNLEKLLQHLN